MAGTDFSHLTDEELLNGIKALNIPDYIRTKSYGIDVRETLAQMTEMLMQLAYNQGMNPQEAQEWVSQLNNKVDKGNLSVTDINKNLGKLDQTFMTDEFLQQMAGNTSINAVPADGSLTTKKFADDSVTNKKLDDGFLSSDMKLSGEVNIDTYYRHGNTILAAPITGTLPEGFEIAQAGIVENTGSGIIVLQKLCYRNNPSIFWTRSLNTYSGVKTEWVKGFGVESIANNSISRSKLTPNFRDGGLYSGDIDTMKAEGSYILVAPFIGNIPSALEKESTLLLDVSVTNSQWVIQKIRNIYGDTEMYTRTFRMTTQPSAYTPWYHNVHTQKKKRKLLFLGDSIPDGSQYPEEIQKNTGIEVVNGAIGGTTFATHAQEAYDPFSGVNLIEAITTGDWTRQDEFSSTINAAKLNLLKGVDLSDFTDIVFAYGTNDAYSITTLGEVDDQTKDSYAGAINLSLEMLFNSYPELQISLISPIYRDRHSVGDGKNSDEFPTLKGNMLYDFVEVLLRQANKHHVQSLDLYNKSGINKNTTQHFQSDGLHLTGAGRDRLANVVGSFLEYSY